MSDWVKFYDFKHSVIYVNARHRDVHYRRIAEDIRAYVASPTAHVLDYGCGEALHADEIAPYCVELYLCEAAPKLRARLEERFASAPNISVLAPEDLKALPAACFDLIVANSVVQYVSRAELESLLALWRRLLDPEGHVLTWNAGVERIKGYRADDIVGQHFSRFYPPEAFARGLPRHELEVASDTGSFEDEGSAQGWFDVLGERRHHRDAWLPRSAHRLRQGDA